MTDKGYALAELFGRFAVMGRVVVSHPSQGSQRPLRSVLLVRQLALSYAAFLARILAHLARCAAAILLRPAADIVRFLRVGLVPV